MSSQLSGSSAPVSGSASTSSGAARRAARRPGRPGAGLDREVTDRIESMVNTVRDKTTVPITKGARAVVFGLVAAVVLIVALVLVVAVVRISTSTCPSPRTAGGSGSATPAWRQYSWPPGRSLAEAHRKPEETQ